MVYAPAPHIEIKKTAIMKVIKKRIIIFRGV
jgi:hypothetical protein